MKKVLLSLLLVSGLASAAEYSVVGWESKSIERTFEQDGHLVVQFKDSPDANITATGPAGEDVVIVRTGRFVVLPTPRSDFTLNIGNAKVRVVEKAKYEQEQALRLAAEQAERDAAEAKRKQAEREKAEAVAAAAAQTPQQKLAKIDAEMKDLQKQRASLAAPVAPTVAGQSAPSAPVAVAQTQCWVIGPDMQSYHQAIAEIGRKAAQPFSVAWELDDDVAIEFKGRACGDSRTAVDQLLAAMPKPARAIWYDNVTPFDTVRIISAAQ